jgi:hypothetical protein
MENVKRKTVSDENRIKERHVHVSYYLRSFTNNLYFNEKVCKVFFAKTFGITLRTIHRWIISREPADLPHKSSKVGGRKKADRTIANKFLDELHYYESHYKREIYSNKRVLMSGCTIK